MSLSVKVKTIISESLGNFLMCFAKDLPLENTKGPCLVIAPHPDDETLGCGATIQRLRRAGNRVRIIVVTDGRSSEQTPHLTPQELAAVREKEMIEACACLEVPAEDIVFLRYKDREASQNMENIARDLVREVEKSPPCRIFLPSGIDKNKDHQAVAKAAAAAVKQAKITPQTYGYIIWFSLKGYVLRMLPLLISGSFRRVEAGSFAAGKLKAFKAHASQYGNVENPQNTFWKRYFRPYELFIERPKA